MASELTRSNLYEAFVMMGELLAHKRISGEIAIYGGSAIMLQMEYRASTEDVDCVVTENHGEVMKAMMIAGKKLNLPSGWLNEGVSIYTSRNEGSSDFMPLGTYPSTARPALRVCVAKPEYLLAMKIAALSRSQQKDSADVRELLEACKVNSVKQALDIYDRYFPRSELKPSARAALGLLVREQREVSKDVDWAPPKPT